MKPVKFLQAIGVIFLFPSLGITIFSTAAFAQLNSARSPLTSSKMPSTDSAMLLHPLSERTYSSLSDSSATDALETDPEAVSIPYEPSLNSALSSDFYMLENSTLEAIIPLSHHRATGHRQTDSLQPRENQGDRENQGRQNGDRQRQRLRLSPRASLNVDVRSDSLQQLDIFEIEEDKESFTFSLERPIWRSPRSELSWSLGFGYRDETLAAPAVPLSQPPSLGAPPSGNPSPSPNLLPSSPPPPSNFPPPSANEPTPAPTRPPNSGPRPASPPRPTAAPPTAAPPTAAPPTAVSPPDSRPPAASASNAVPLDALLAEQPRPPAPATADSMMRTGVIEFAQNYRQRDHAGQWLARSQFNLGTELADSPENMGADAQFFSWSGRVERTQRLGRDHRLTLRLETQFSPSRLLPMHQFKTKDRRFESFSREARPAEISGNSGVHLYLEDDIVLLRSRRQAPLFSLIPFVDAGYTWGQSSSNKPNQQLLGRTGLGMVFEPTQGLIVRYDYLTYWGDLSAASERQNQYVTLTYRTRW